MAYHRKPLPRRATLSPALLQELYVAQEFAIEHIAGFFAYSYATVFKALADAGIPRRHVGSGGAWLHNAGQDLGQEFTRELAEQFLAHHYRLRDIAAYMRCSVGYASGKLGELGIEWPRGSRHKLPMVPLPPRLRPDEQWLPLSIASHDHGLWAMHFEVSSLGNIRNKRTQEVLKPTCRKTGHYSVQLNLREHKAQKTVTLALAVASAFVPNPLASRAATHLDGNKANNRADNIAWMRKNPKKP